MRFFKMQETYDSFIFSFLFQENGGRFVKAGEKESSIIK